MTNALSLARAALLLAALASACAPVAAQAQPSQAAAATPPTSPTSPSVPAWQREAVPFYDTVQTLQGIYGHWALPRAQDFDRSAHALVPAVAALCAAPASDSQAALQAARAAWQTTTRAWERLAAVSVGPVIARRSQRAISSA